MWKRGVFFLFKTCTLSFCSDAGVTTTELKPMYGSSMCLKMVICWINRCGSSYSATFKLYIQLKSPVIDQMLTSQWFIVGSIWNTSKPSSFSTWRRVSSVMWCHGGHFPAPPASRSSILCPPPPQPPPLPQIVMKPPWSLLTVSGTTQRPLLLVTRRFRWNLA